MKWHRARRQQEKWSYIQGGFILSLSLFLGLSLLSYSPQDPSFNSFGLSLKVSNYCGYVGAFLSDLFFQLFGMMSWLFVPLGFLFSFRLFQPHSRKHLFQGTLQFFFFFLSFSCLLQLYFPKIFFYEKTITFGGAFSSIVLKGLTSFFHTTGTGLILGSILGMSFLLYGQKIFIQIFRGLKKAVFQLGKAIFFSFKIGISFIFYQIKQIFKKDWRAIFYKLKKVMAKIKIKKPTSVPLENSMKDSAKISFSYQNESIELKPTSPTPSPASKVPKVPTATPQTKIETTEADEEDQEILLHSEENLQKLKKFSIENSPPLDILTEPPALSQKMSRGEVEILAKKLTDKLKQFSINGRITAIKTGPAVIMFEFKPGEDVKVSRIKEMATDLSLALSSESVRIIAPIPGRDVVGIEASSPYREKVYLKNMLREASFAEASLPLVLGRRSDNAIYIRDLVRIPHLLIAGTTGSGKSVFVISFITSLLFRHTPDTLRLIVIDPKRVDLSVFNDIPHLLSPIITSTPQTVKALNWAISEMEKRYRSLAEFGVRDVASFNKMIDKLSAKEKHKHALANESSLPGQNYYFNKIPFICIIIEEFGDLMADIQFKKGVETAVVRLAQKARASGIHLVLAMQSPRKDVVTGLIKTNIPGRISFKVASGTDSRVILDEVGAERLLSHGDMLFLEPGTSKALRYHGPFVSEKEAARVAEHWKQQGPTAYEEALTSVAKDSFSLNTPVLDDIENDPMYAGIIAFVQECEFVSTSLLQRKFRIGYPRAARLIESLYEKGVIGPPKGSKPREVLINK